MMSAARAASRRTGGLALIVLGVIFVLRLSGVLSQADAPPAPGSDPAAARGGAAALKPSGDPGAAAIVRAFERRASGSMVEAEGTVEATLRDDREGSRHQRFIVRLEGDHTVLIAHNIDLAPRVPLERGDRVRFRGEYEWNERGGVIHWTHDDPQRRHPGGWIRHEGKDYR
jgi:hypothetical protein